MKELTDLPPGVIGFESAGWVHAADYRDVMIPAVERAAAEGDSTRGGGAPTANGTAATRAAVRSTQRSRRWYCQFVKVSGRALD